MPRCKSLRTRISHVFSFDSNHSGFATLPVLIRVSPAFCFFVEFCKHTMLFCVHSAPFPCLALQGRERYGPAGHNPPILVIPGVTVRTESRYSVIPCVIS